MKILTQISPIQIVLAISFVLSSQVRALDLLGYWDFNDNTNPAVAPEVSGNSPDAALAGVAVFSADGAGYSGIPGDRSLDVGTVNNGARAQVPGGSHLNAAFTNNAMAVSVWQYNTGIGNTSTFWVRSPGAGANFRGFQAHIPWGNGTVFFDHAGCCGPTQRRTVGGQIQLNQWQHFVFQKDATGRKQIWVDGNLVNEQASGATALLAFDGQISIGAEFPGLNSFGGRIDEFAVFDDALDPIQIAALAGGASPDEITVIANDDTGATGEDTVLSVVDPGATASLLDNDFNPPPFNPPTFHPISSASASTAGTDLWPVSNLIQGPGVGFDAAAPFDQDPLPLGVVATRWVTAAPGGFPNDYFVNPGVPPVIMLDLGQDRGLDEISVWGYVSTNGNGVSAFSLRFATDAEGPGGFGSSIAFNPTFNPTNNDVVRQSFSFAQTVAARYVEFTATDNFFGAVAGGDRVGLGEIAFQAPSPVIAFDAASANGAAVTVAGDGTFSYDPTGAPALRALGEGETVDDTFTYTISDGSGPPPLGGVTGELALWLDGSDIDADGSPDSITNGAAITNWQDKSGNNRDASGVLGTPFYVASSAASSAGAPAVGFSAAGGADQLFTSYNFDNLGANYTVFAVSRYSGGANARVVTSKTRNWLFGHHGNLDERWYADGWIHQTGSGNTALHMYTGIIGPAVNGNAADPGADFWKDGVQLANNHQGSSNTTYKPGAIALGAWTGGGEASNAEVAELIIYDRALSDAERLAVEDYLDEKYFGGGVAATDSATVTVTVTGVNDTPSANDDAYASDEDTAISVPGGVNLHQLDSLPTGDYQLTADGDTFQAHVDHDGTNGWLLIGRGRNGWLFDNNATTGQQTPDDVNDNLGTPAAFAPAHYRDNIVLDLLNAVGADMSDVEIRLLRAGDNAGAGDYQEIIWSGFTGKGGVFSWDFDDNAYGVTQNRLTAPAGLPGASVGTTPSQDTRDQITAGNNGNRVFTWPWGGHGSQQGFSYGQTVTTGSGSATSYFWELSNENHAIPYTEVYIRVTSAELPGLLLNDSDSEIDGGNPSQVLEIVSAGLVTGGENVLPDTEALPGDPPTGVDSVTITSALGASVTVFDDGGFDYDPTSGPLQALVAGEVVVDSFVYVATDNDPVMPLTDTATAFITVTGINDAPEVTLPGIPDSVITTSNPTVTIPLFNYFEDVDDADNTLSYTVTMNDNTTLIQTLTVNSADGLLVINTPCTLIGMANIEVTATDPGMLTAVDSFKVTVVDNVPPVISGHPKRVIVNAAPGAPDAIVHYGPVTAVDKVDGPRPVTCAQASGTAFTVGAHTVTCTSSDLSNTVAMVSFEVIVVPTTALGVGAPIATVSIRGESAPGSTTFLTYEDIYLNDLGEILLQGRASGNTRGVWTDAGTPGTLGSAVALQGGAAGALGTFTRFTNLALDDSGDNLFMANLAGHFLNGVDVAVETTAATGGGTYRVLHKPALGGADLITPANLLISGAVTFTSDTGLFGSFGGTLENPVHEGGPLPASVGIPGGRYGQVAPRVVMNPGGQVAFSANLVVTAGVTLLDNTGVFTGLPPVGGGLGTLSIIAREGSVAPGTGPNVFAGFQSESIGVNGEVAFLGSIRPPAGGSPVPATENQGLWTNASGPLQLVAREGSVAPCLPVTGVLFDRFEEVFVTNSGEVHFRAYLKGIGVDSSSDESLWRWEPGSGLNVIVREGDLAPGTGDAPIRDILDYAVSEAGLVAYTARFMTGIGDATTTNNQGLFTTDTALGIPVLRVRKGDVYTIAPHDRKITEITLSSSANAKGGTGGYGRVINDMGEVSFRASMNFNSSGAFVLVP